MQNTQNPMNMAYSLPFSSKQVTFKQTNLAVKFFATLIFSLYSIFAFSAKSPMAVGTSTFTANNATGTWSTPGHWTVTGGGSTSTYPGQAAGNVDVVVIPAGMSVNITAAIPQLASISTIDIQGTGIITTNNQNLTCTGLTSTVAGGTITKGTGTLLVNGSSSVTTITFTGAGTLTVVGNLTASTLTGSGANAINVSGNWNVTSFTQATSTVTLNGGAQSILSANTFNNLAVTAAGTKSLGAATNIAGTLAVSAGLLDPAGFSLSVTGTTTISGTGNITDSNASGTNTFGNLTLTAGTLDLSAASTANVVFNTGTIINTAGTFNVPNLTLAAGAHIITNNNSAITWSSNNISIAGTSTAFTFNGSQLVTINGTAPVTFNTTLAVGGAGGLTLSTTGAVSMVGAVTVSGTASLIDTDNTSTTTFGGGLTLTSGTVDMSALSTANCRFNAGTITSTAGTFNIPNLTFVTGAFTITNNNSAINWSSNNISIAAASTTFAFSGSQNVTISGTAPVTFNSSLTVNGAGGLTLSTTGAVIIGTTTAVSAGTLTLSTTNTVLLTGLVTVSGTGTLVDTDNTTTTTFGAGLTLTAGTVNMSALSTANCRFNAGTITSTAGTFNIPNLTFVSGAYTITNNNSAINWSSNNISIAGASTTFAFSGSQNVTISGTAPVTFNSSLTVNGAGGLTLSTTGAVIIGTTTAVSAGTLTLSTSNTVLLTGLVTVSGTGTLVDTDNTTTTTFGAGLTLTAGTVNMSALSTANCRFNAGTITSTAGTFNIPNLTFVSGAYTITNNNSAINWSSNNISIAAATTGFTFNGSQLVTISGSAPETFNSTLAVSGAGGLTLSTTGAVSVGGAVTVSAGTLTLSTTNTVLFTGAVTVSGTGSLIDNDNTTTTTFSNSLTLTAGTVNLSALSTANCVFNGAVTNTAGTFNVPTATIVANGQTITATQSTNFSGGVNITGAGALTFTGAGGTILGGTTSPTFPAALTVSAGSTLQLATTGITTVTTTSTLAGTLDINGKIFAALGNITINNGGTLNVGANGTLRMASGTSVANSGIFKAVGTAGNIATVTNNGAGNYTITQSAATGVFHAKYATFQNTNGNGVSLTAGSIDAVNDFDFTNFTNGSGTCYLNLTGLTITSYAVNGANFDAGPTYNVQRTAGAGTITFNDATGTLALGTLGETNDNDNGNPGTLIIWANSALAYYSGATGVFSDLNNWWSNSNGTGSHPTAAKLTDGTSNFIVQNAHVITVDQNLDVLSLQSTGTSTLTFGNNATGRTVITEGDITIGVGTTWNVGATSATHILDVKGNFTNNGTVNFMPSASRIVNLYLDGNVSTYTIGGTSTPSLANVTINSAAYSNVPYTAAVALNINGTLTINANGSLNAGSFTHIIGGDWSQATAAGFVASTSTVQFSGTGSVGGTANPITFNNVTCNGGTATIFAQNIVVNGNFLVNNNTTTQGSTYTLSYNGSFNVAAGSIYVAGATSTVNFSGTSAQAIDFTNASFNTINFTGAGVKTCTGTLSSAIGVVTVALGSTVTGNALMTFSNHLQIDGTCNWSGSVTMNGGNAYIQTSNASGTYSLGTADLICSGTIWLRNTVGGIGVNPANLAVGGNLTVNSTYLVLQNNTTLTGLVGKTLTLSPNSNLYCRGVNNFPTGFGTYLLDVSSTVLYDQNINQTVRGNITYGILNLSGASVSVAVAAPVNGTIKTVDNPIDVNGNLNLNGNNVILDLNGKTGNTFAGGTLNNAGGTCVIQNTGATGSFVLDADDANQTIQAGIYTFNNFTISQGAPIAARTKTINSNITLTGNFFGTNPGGDATNTLTIALGANLISGSATRTFGLDANVILTTTNADFGSNMLNSFTGAKTFNVASTVSYNLGGAQTIASSANVSGGIIYGNINMGGSGNKTPGAALDINGNITSSGGVFVDAGLSHTVAGDWLLATANYTPTGTITLDGVNQNVSLNTVGATTFNNLIVAGSGTKSQNATVTINADFTVNSGPTYNANSRNINIAGNWSQANGGVFTQTYSTGAGTGITTFNGTASGQTVNVLDASSYFGAVIINKSLAFPKVTFTSSATISSYLDVYGPNVPLGAIAGGIDFSNQSLYVGDNFYIRAGASFLATASTLYLNGSNNQDIIMDCATPTLFNLDCSAAGTKRLRSASATGNIITIENDVNINGSTLDAIAYNAVDLLVAGNWTNTGVYTGGTSRTVTFNGASQTIDQTTFGNVIFTGTNTKTLTGAITASNNLTIGNTATLDVDATNNYSISVGGYWDNSQGGIFVPQQGTVTFIGNSSNLYSGTTVAPSNGVSAMPAVGKNFYNVTVNKNAGQTLTLNTLGASYGDLSVTNDLTISLGTLSTNGYDVFIGGNFVNTSVITMPGSYNSAISLVGTGAVTKTFDVGTGANVIRDVFVNAGATTTYAVANNLTITNNNSGTTGLIINSGTFDLNGKSLTFGTAYNGNVINITGANGTFNTGVGGYVYLANRNIVLNNGGVLKVVGTAAFPATFTKASGATGYTVSQTGATAIFHAKYFDFQYLNAVAADGGIVLSGGSIDPINCFTNGTFSNGLAGSAQYLDVSCNSASLIADNVTINTGPLKNIKAGTSTGTFIVNNATGTMSTFANENDDASATTGHVQWTSGGMRWTGATTGGDGVSWNNPLNWSSGSVPTATDIVVIDHSTVAAAIAVSIPTGVNAVGLRLTVDKGAGAAISLTLNGTSTLTLGENLAILNGSNLTAASGNAISLAGNWTISATSSFTAGTSTVTFAPTAGTKLITPGPSAFNNIVFGGSSTTTVTLGAAITANGNITISGCTLDVTTANLGITVNGNWSVSGTGVFNPRAGTVTFSKAGAQSISGSPFYNLTTAGSGTKSIVANLSIYGSVTIGAGTVLDGAANTLSVGLNWSNAVGAAGFTQTGVGSVLFNGGASGNSNQTIDGGAGVTTFNNVIVSNAGTTTWSASSNVNGDFTINSGSGTINMQTFTILGTAGRAFTMSGTGNMQLRGLNNFPSGFGTYSLASNSTVTYIGDLAQNIKTIASPGYGNLTVQRASAGTWTKTALGDLIVQGNLTINDANTVLDVNANSANIILTGNLAVANGYVNTATAPINWGTGTTTITHNGAGWNIDADITTFNNMIMSGTGTKTMFANLMITGNVTVNNGVSLTMGLFTMNCTAGAKIFTLNNGSQLNCAIPSSVGVAFPTGFTTYALDANSLTYLNGQNNVPGDQTVKTVGVTYGNLRFADPAAVNRTVNIEAGAHLVVAGYFGKRKIGLETLIIFIQF